MALLAHKSCGTGANGPEGRMLKAVWKSMKTFFNLTKVKKASGTTEYDLSGGTDEAEDCSQAPFTPFPLGAYAAMPIYLAKDFKAFSATSNLNAKVLSAGTNDCHATSVPTKYIIYVKDAYRTCALADAFAA